MRSHGTERNVDVQSSVSTSENARLTLERVAVLCGHAGPCARALCKPNGSCSPCESYNIQHATCNMACAVQDLRAAIATTAATAGVSPTNAHKQNTAVLGFLDKADTSPQPTETKAERLLPCKLCATMSEHSCDVSSVRGRCSLSASRLNEPTMTKGDEMISGKRTSAYIGIL